MLWKEQTQPISDRYFRGIPGIPSVQFAKCAFFRFTIPELSRGKFSGVLFTFDRFIISPPCLKVFYAPAPKIFRYIINIFGPFKRAEAPIIILLFLRFGNVRSIEASSFAFSD
ncbi:hypothetical protein CHM34_17930 [Paludifilum halophilum]|uniref:Uncharacterized protein n=1 Tax=Paludifilum halophilum TaxID=1642702 RepID=A0A235B1I1_9BACL|nr:hypothetical protein CHM34_17930 [Paludifilum halophilum]